MNYNPTKKVFQLSAEDADTAARWMLYAIRKVKQSAKLPLTPHKTDEAMSDADHAMYGILRASESLGLDLGAQWGRDLDSTNHT